MHLNWAFERLSKTLITCRNPKPFKMPYVAAACQNALQTPRTGENSKQKKAHFVGDSKIRTMKLSLSISIMKHQSSNLHGFAISSRFYRNRKGHAFIIQFIHYHSVFAGLLTVAIPTPRLNNVMPRKTNKTKFYFSFFIGIKKFRSN